MADELRNILSQYVSGTHSSQHLTPVARYLIGQISQHLHYGPARPTVSSAPDLLSPSSPPLDQSARLPIRATLPRLIVLCFRPALDAQFLFWSIPSTPQTTPSWQVGF